MQNVQDRKEIYALARDNIYRLTYWLPSTIYSLHYLLFPFLSM